MNNYPSFPKLPLSGLFLVFEGLDGSGKTTQCDMLARALESLGYEVVQTREPTYGVWGQQIREKAFHGRKLSANEELELFILDRKEHLDEFILPSLREGKIVIQDRYFLSTLAYQGSRGLDPQTILQEHQKFAPLPHQTYMIEISPQEGIQRITQSRHEQPNAFEQLDGLTKCKKIFDEVELPHLLRLDGTLSPQSLHDIIKKKTLSLPFFDR